MFVSLDFIAYILKHFIVQKAHGFITILIVVSFYKFNQKLVHNAILKLIEPTNRFHINKKLVTTTST